MVGAAGSTTGKTQVPETPQPASEPSSDSELQSQIQNALSKEPTLSGDTVNVRVTAESINITGSVATAREKLTATRIVDSYAGNRKVISHLTIGDKNRNAAPAAATRPPQ
ncbi:MAG TPA: BON domain-containing protein [Candidatus Angelobacter sp.]|nr:BON domain-containing protein [Candidatus Angelobacter sp.]